MGNLDLYVSYRRKRARELRAGFLAGDPGVDLKELLAGLTEAQRSLYEERAAILEHDGGLIKEEAEREALKEILTAGKA